MSEVYEKLQRADAWILGSPVYQGHVSGQLKTLLDRCRAVVAADPARVPQQGGDGHLPSAATVAAVRSRHCSP